MNDEDRRLLVRLGEVQLANAELRTDSNIRPFLVLPNGQGLGQRPAISHPGLGGLIEYDADQVGRLIDAGYLGVDRVIAKPEFFIYVTPEGLDAVGLD